MVVALVASLIEVSSLTSGGVRTIFFFLFFFHRNVDFFFVLHFFEESKFVGDRPGIERNFRNTRVRFVSELCMYLINCTSEYTSTGHFYCVDILICQKVEETNIVLNQIYTIVMVIFIV